MSCVEAQVRGTGGWVVRGAILSVMDLSGQQAGHAVAGEEGTVSAGPLAPATLRSATRWRTRWCTRA